jgi:hypothetical protein
MTKDQKDTVATDIREKAEDFVQGATIASTVVLNVLNENPELIENVGDLLVKYWSVFKPLIDSANQDAIGIRVDQFRELKRLLGLSDELTVKLICGQ